MSVLHTWGQNLQLHPHVHCVVPGGGLSADGSRWVNCRPGFFLPVRVLSRVFRGKFIDGLRKVFVAGHLRSVPDAAAFESLVDSAVRTDWVVYAKPPFGVRSRCSRPVPLHAPDRHLKQQARVDGRPDHHLRLEGLRPRQSPPDDDARRREFLRRFLLHVVPTGFVRIRHFGLFANRVRTANVERCRKLLGAQTLDNKDAEAPAEGDGHATEHAERCPLCACGHMIRGQRLTAQQLFVVRIPRNDSS